MYIDNPTLEMMMGCLEGNNIQVVKSYLLKASKMFCSSLTACTATAAMYFSGEKQLIIKYIMDRYANMFGAYFVKYRTFCHRRLPM